MSAVELAAYPGYQIYDDGRIYLSRSNRWMKPTLNSNGYLRCTIVRADGKHINMYIHKLVALAYIPAVEGKTYVDHINGNKLDNRAANLRWCTNVENITFDNAVQARVEYMRSERFAEDQKRRAVSRSKPVLCVTTGIAFHGVSEAGRCMRLCASDIIRAIRDKNTVRGYTFCYITKSELSSFPCERVDISAAAYVVPDDVQGKGLPVLCVTTGEIFKSAKDAAINNATSLNNIARCARGERHSTGGKQYKYISWREYKELAELRARQHGNYTVTGGKL